MMNPMKRVNLLNFFKITSSLAMCLMPVVKDQIAVRLNMDGCPDSMAVADLGKDPSLVVDVEVVS